MIVCLPEMFLIFNASFPRSLLENQASLLDRSHLNLDTNRLPNDVRQWKMKGSRFTTDGSNETYWRMSGSNLLLHPSRAWICASPHLSVDGTLMITTILALKHWAVIVSQPAAVELCPVQAPAATPATVKTMGPLSNGGAPLVQEAPSTPRTPLTP